MHQLLLRQEADGTCDGVGKRSDKRKCKKNGRTATDTTHYLWPQKRLVVSLGRGRQVLGLDRIMHRCLLLLLLLLRIIHGELIMCRLRGREFSNLNSLVNIEAAAAAEQ